MTLCARSLWWSLLLPIFLNAPARAQGARLVVQPELGLFGGRQFKDDEWVAGGYFRWPLLGILDLRPSGDVAPGSSHNYQLNGDIALHGPRDLAYLGAGYAWAHRDFGGNQESASGVNLFIGFKPVPRAGTQVYLEGRWTLVNSATIFRLLLGASFHL